MRPGTASDDGLLSLFRICFPSIEGTGRSTLVLFLAILNEEVRVIFSGLLSLRCQLALITQVMGPSIDSICETLN